VATTEIKGPEESGTSEKKKLPYRSRHLLLPLPHPSRHLLLHLPHRSRHLLLHLPLPQLFLKRKLSLTNESTPALADVEAAASGADEEGKSEDEVKEVECVEAEEDKTQEEADDDMVDDDDVMVVDGDDAAVVIDVDDGANEDEQEVEELQIDEPEEPRKPDTPMATSSAFGGAMTGQTTTFGAPRASAAFGQGFQGPTSFGSMATSSTQHETAGEFDDDAANLFFWRFRDHQASYTVANFSHCFSFWAFVERRTSFGSFVGGGGMSTRPLFGTPAPPPAEEEQQPEAADEDEMEGGEGEMEEDHV
jgi:hypothetical protein